MIWGHNARTRMGKFTQRKLSKKNEEDLEAHW